MCLNYQKQCRILIKAQILPSHFIRHLQEHFFFRKLSWEYAFGSSSTKFKLLVILVIISLFGFGPQGPMGFMQLMNRDLPELGFEFEILETFNLETATGGAP